MNCPVCKTFALEPATLEANLTASTCANCGGHWISGKEYWKWMDVHGENLPERLPAGDEPEVHDSAGPKICPEDGHFLRAYRTGHDLAFDLDHCASCYGIWFDHNEWEVLKGRNLHDEVHYFFSEAYQAGIFKEEHAAIRRKALAERFGEQDFAEILRIKRWIDGHPKRRELLAFLLNEV
jgi:Zn-finger nucleic acid-binding protein